MAILIYTIQLMKIRTYNTRFICCLGLLTSITISTCACAFFEAHAQNKTNSVRTEHLRAACSAFIYVAEDTDVQGAVLEKRAVSCHQSSLQQVILEAFIGPWLKLH